MYHFQTPNSPTLDLLSLLGFQQQGLKFLVIFLNIASPPFSLPSEILIKHKPSLFGSLLLLLHSVYFFLKFSHYLWLI